MPYKKGQISTEYLIIAGFVIFIVISLSGIALVYSSSIQERILFNNLNNFASKLISSAESVYYYGEPSQETIQLYLPKNIKTITISDKEIVFTISTKSGDNIISYTSKVPIEGTVSPSEGTKSIIVSAKPDKVLISE